MMKKKVVMAVVVRLRETGREVVGRRLRPAPVRGP